MNANRRECFRFFISVNSRSLAVQDISGSREIEMARKPQQKKIVETLIHDEATRKNIPTAECQSVMNKQTQPHG